MCGITGVLLAAPTPDVLRSIVGMTEALHHRGPDDGAIFSDENAGIALGHRRLAVVELSDLGAQPMHSADGRYVIVFNGEIYNHLALREQLEFERGVEWRGSSDTETLIECFAAWGVVATLKKSVGMFALALWDRREQCLTLARDRFGEKPLYFGFVGRGCETAFVFGSELKALCAFERFDCEIDRDALALFLRYSYIPAPWSIYRDIFKLEPSTVVVLSIRDIAGRYHTREKYWDYEKIATAGIYEAITDEESALNELERVISQAVGLQLVADVPVGAFLSGGVDSSIIAALMQARSSRPIKTFTVGFDEVGFDEAPHAREVARHLGTDHCEIYVTPSEARSVIPILPTMYDEPFGDSSQIPTSIVCATARRDVTVAISGDGGDELFGGYNRYVVGPRLWQNLSKVPAGLRGAIGSGLNAFPDSGWAAIARLPGVLGALAPFRHKAYKLGTVLGTLTSTDDLYDALATEWSEIDVPVHRIQRNPSASNDRSLASGIRDPAQRMMLLDGLGYLPDDILVKIDRAAMAVSLETRVPLLDHRVAEFAWRLPLSMKVREGQGKWALRQVLYRHVPRELVERPKAGFAIPVGRWLRGPLRDWADDLLAHDRLSADGYLDVEAVVRMWSEHRSGKRDWTNRLWNVLSFQGWLSARRDGKIQ